jgi:chemotaxis-related protein WspD
MEKSDNHPNCQPSILASDLIQNEQDTGSHPFDRPLSQEYIEELTETFTQSSSSEKFDDILSVLVFCLGNEWLALPTIYFKEVTQRRSMHRIPHRKGKILFGIVNLNGELQLYVGLHQLLGIESTTSQILGPRTYQRERMIVIAKGDDLWVFPVDEIDGIYHWNLSVIEKVPANVYQSTAKFVKGIMKMDNKCVALLDEELLFSGLKRSIQ